MTNESWIPAPSKRTPMATSENTNKIVDCDHCDREHWAPPPPPPFYSSFAIPLMRNQSYRRQLQQWIRDNNQWRRITQLDVKNNGGDPLLNIKEQKPFFSVIVKQINKT